MASCSFRLKICRRPSSGWRGALDQAQRSQLAEAMLRDVLTAASAVSPDRCCAGHRRCAGAADGAGIRLSSVIEDTRNESETAAIAMATEWCEERGYDTTIVVPGDIPLIARRGIAPRAGRCARGRRGVGAGV